MIQKWYDDFVPGERQITRARTITEGDIVQFAMLSGDWNPLHTDAVYAEGERFGARIAHGMLVLATATGLTPLESPYVLAFYGLDRVRFIAPTFIGDTLHVESELADKQDRDESSGLLTFAAAIINQRGETVAVYQMKLLIARRSLVGASAETGA